MTCAEFANEIVDAALGGARSEALEGHLEGCEPCRAHLARERELAALVDAELRAALAVEPSPDLAMRTRRRLHQEAARRTSPARWLLPVAAMLLAGLALGRWIIRAPSGTPIAEVPVTTATSLPPARGSVATPANRISKRAPEVPSPPRAVAPRAPDREVPVVLIDPAERQALDRFIVSAGTRIVGPASVLVSSRDELDEIEIGTIEVASVRLEPLQIEPLEGSQS